MSGPLAVGAPASATPIDGSAVPDWVRSLDERPATEPDRSAGPRPVPVPLSRSVPAKPAAAPVFPTAASWDVELRGAGTGKAAGGPARPVRVAAAAGAPAGTADTRVRVRVADRATAQRVGANGFVFSVADPTAADPAGIRAAFGGGTGAVPVELTVDYSGFADAFGAGYADRLRVVALPDCVLLASLPAGCHTAGTPLPVRNDVVAKRLVVEVKNLPALAAFAVTSAPGGESGTFAASQLSITGSWQVSPGSGAFTYSYPIDVPAVPGGSAPSVALGYSSAAVDGLTVATNTQAGQAGLGWSDFANAFVERRYEPCHLGVNMPTGDLCWDTDNATISLGGISGPLIPVNPARTEWRVQNDPGWRVLRMTTAVNIGIHENQFWQVIGPDGTKYQFGVGHMPGRYTNSVLGVPVFADDPGEPCRGAGDVVGACTQGWRWYLDRVIDPDGNVQSLLYERETNWYAAMNGWPGPLNAYHRSAMLKEIIYGGRDWDPDKFAARVTFIPQSRCVTLNDTCGPATRDNGSWFLDVPNDLICSSTMTPATCPVHSPSFFSTKRYAGVRTEVKVGAAWKLVAQHNLIHKFPTGASGEARKLQLERIQQVGLAYAKMTPMPDTVFGYVWGDNRADNDAYIPKAMRHNRLSRITNPTGGRIDVTYGWNRFCERTYNAWPRWDLNVRDCFPQAIVDNGFQRKGVFHKHLVMQVTETPGVGLASTTRYTYEGDPAWTFNEAAFAEDTDEIGWSRWAGYGTVTVAKGTSKTRVRLFRGLDGDRMRVEVPGGGYTVGQRSVSVSTFDTLGTAVSYPDHWALAGRTLEEQQIAVSGAVLQARRHEYERHTVYDSALLFDPEWVGLKSTTERVAGGSGYRERRSQTTYTKVVAGGYDYYQLTATLEEGWLDVPGDERCSITSYANNLAENLLVYPAANRKVSGDCASTEVLTSSETYYDGSATLGAAPTSGKPTRQRTLIESGRWAQTQTGYDVLGRPVTVTGPTGAVTTTAYVVPAGAPEVQIVAQTTVTDAKGHQVVTKYTPEFQLPIETTDANGNVTSQTYDEFGRLTAVRLPTERFTTDPSWKFTYDLTNRAVKSQRLVTAGVFQDSWVIYDGFWREVQTQGRSTVSGKALVSETSYDDRGQLYEETVEQALTGTPGGYIAGGSSWLNRTRHRYDELGREIAVDWYRGTALAHTTGTVYGIDGATKTAVVTVTGPDGRQVRERSDGHGRTVAVEEFDGSTWVSSTHTYDLADRMLSVTDPEGNRTSYGYNLVGWRVSQQDPNRGSASFAYDDAGRQTRSTDVNGNQIHTIYDVLGRPVERRKGSSTGTKLAEWVYDTAPKGKGRLHRTLSYSASGTWISETVGYDTRGRSTGTTVTVPAGIPGLSGTYTTGRTYDAANQVRTATFPAIGGLPQETVTTDYSSLGLPTRMAGLAEYVRTVSYDDRGRKVSAGFGPQVSGATWLGRSWTYDIDQRSNGVETYLAGSSPTNGIISDHEVAFDAAGNLTEQLTRQMGLAWRECYGYDARSRLTSAHTVTSTSTCATGTAGTGDRPYRHTYRYSPGGRLLERVEQGVSTTYTYPASGSAKPHAPTKVGEKEYAWGDDGKLLVRGVSGGEADWFGWNVQGTLDVVYTPAGATSFEYDPSGQRLLRRTPDGKTTVYVAGHEVTANADGSSVTAVRSYSFDGEPVATRTPTGLDYLVTDAGGSVELAVASNATGPAATRSYTPYGKVRAETGSTATDRGFLSQIEDDSTKLSYLNARYYDTTIGLFISTDPVYDTARVKTLNPYSYSVNNPTTYADPGGRYSSYTWGLEVENAKLRDQNRQLVAHIGVLGNHIEYLQDVIRRQQKAINQLITYVEALEAEISRQATIIQQLQDRVRYLEGVVVAQRREISRLRSVVARQAQIIRYQAGVIRYQAGVIGYYKGVVNELGGRLWGHNRPQHDRIMSSIHSGRGIPGDAFNYDWISAQGFMLRDRDSTIGSLRSAVVDLGDLAAHSMMDSLMKTIEINRLSREIEAGKPGLFDIALDVAGFIPHPVAYAAGAYQLHEDLDDSGFYDAVGDRWSDMTDPRHWRPR